LKKSFEYMNLATILGKVVIGLATQPLEKLEVALFGRAAEVETRPISVAALVGVLGGQFETPVNRVNAENIAKRQGISLIESKTEETEDYVSLIKVSGHSADSSISASGVLLGGRHPRLICINHFDIEVVPEGTLLITRHDDRPGVISAISAVLGNANINITRMQVGMADGQKQAMAVISVTEPVSEDLLQQLHNVPPVHQVTQIRL
ncbi:MAG: ACT domain-containing protein, partial [Methylococcaceae bacterium]|nr:ACT domain-containing protein [Methylococcaceae bacterium]